MTQLFNQRALKKHHQAGKSDSPVTLLTPPLRATMVLGILIAISGGVWATIARIPVNVRGTGVLLPVSTINSSKSNTNGTAIYMFNRPEENWHRTARLFLQSPNQFSDVNVESLALEIYNASQEIEKPVSKVNQKDSSSNYAKSLEKTFKGMAISNGRLLLWVRSAPELQQLSSSLDHLQRTLKKTTNEANNIQEKQKILRQELKSRTDYLINMKKLAAKGYVTRQNILEQQSQADNLRSEIHSNDNELIRIAGNRDEAYQKLREQTAIVISNEMIFAPRDVYVSNIIPNDGESVSQDKILMELSDNRLDEPVMVPAFLSSKEMAQVFPGMKVLATPSGYKRSEVGGITGRVVSMAKLPSGVDEISARIGVKAMANQIVSQHPSPTLVVLALNRSITGNAVNTGGYRWSSNSSLPFPPTPGDTLDVEITTRRVAPIELVLPAVREFLGLVPPNSTPTSSPPQQSGQSKNQSEK